MDWRICFILVGNKNWVACILNWIRVSESADLSISIVGDALIIGLISFTKAFILRYVFDQFKNILHSLCFHSISNLRFLIEF